MHLSLFLQSRQILKTAWIFGWPALRHLPRLPDGESGTAVTASALKTKRNYGTTVQPRSQRDVRG